MTLVVLMGGVLVVWRGGGWRGAVRGAWATVQGGGTTALRSSVVGPKPRSHAPQPRVVSLSTNQAPFSPGSLHLRASLSLPTARDLHLTRDSDMGTPRFVRRRSAYLSGPAPGLEPDEIAAALIEANGKAFTLAPTDIEPPNARIARDVLTKHNGMRSLTWQQQHDDLDIYGATFAMNLDRENRIINVQSRALHIPSVRSHDVVKVGEEELEGIIGEHLAPRRQDAESNEVQTSVLRSPSSIYYPLDQISVVRCWDILVEKEEKNAQHPSVPETHRLIIRADTGAVVEDISLTWTLEDVTYNVYTNDSPLPMTPGPDVPTNYTPVEVSRTNITLSAWSTNASPEGWIPDGNSPLVGNNAHVYADWDDNDAPDGPAVTGTTYRVFDHPYDHAGNPADYVDFSQVQAFYVANLFHDRMYAFGFDEAAGNFQNNNFGRGGAGGDALKIEIQNDENAGGLHGIYAFYQGWGDGTYGKVSVSTSSNPTRRDGAMDAELLLHEITHGLTTRLIGNGFGLTTTQARGLAEGWSDFLPLALLSEAGDSADGCYPFASYLQAANKYGVDRYYGIRRFPYSTDTNKAPQTLGDIDPNQMYFSPSIPRNPDFGSEDADQIHNIGEIWCLMLWECRNDLMERYGVVGNEMIMQLVVDALKLTPENPNFEEARDALLQADLVTYGGTNQIAFWRGFAKRGLGYGAVVPGAVGTAGIEESYALPFEVEPVLTEKTGDGDGYVEPGESGELVVALTSHEMGLSNVVGMLSASNSQRGTSNIQVTVSNSVLPDAGIGGVSTSAPPFEFAVSNSFAGNSNAWFMLTVESDQGVFGETLSLMIGNPYDYPPKISGVSIEPGVTNAVVSWETEIESTGTVKWGLGGTTNGHGWTSIGIDHSVTLDGLLSGSNYLCQAVAVGTNGLTNVTEEISFRTHSYVYVYADSTATQEMGTLDAPFKSLQAAANFAKLTGDAVHVAMGTYTSDQVEAVLDLDGSDWDIVIEGGYSADFTERDIECYETVIDGQRTRRGIRLDNGAALRIDGVMITRGQGEWGGGVHVRQSEFDANRCLIVDNASTNGVNNDGGGVYCTLASAVHFLQCGLVENTAGSGGGMQAVSSGTEVAIVNCELHENASQYAGGGINLSLGAEVQLVGCLVISNTAVESAGGGIVVGPFCQAEIQSCTVSGNAVSAPTEPDFDGGGGVAIAASSLGPAELALNSTVVYGNTSRYGDDVWQRPIGQQYAAIHVNNCAVGELVGTLTTSNNITSADPLFANRYTGDFHLLYSSPCIDAGSTNAGASIDMDGEARPFGLAMDIGADEFVDGDGDHMADYRETREYEGTNTTDGTEDTDGDALNTFGEYMNQTDPHDRDTDDDEMWDGWEVAHLLNVHSNDAAMNPDGDPHNNLNEFAADTDPHDSNSILRVLSLGEEWGGTRIDWRGGVDSRQWLEWNTNLMDSGGWDWIAGFPPPTPTGNAMVVFGLTNSPTFYRIRAKRE